MKYTGEYTREISFPIGGIGTGSFGIAGNGGFVDWEIFNHPNKGSILDFSHIAVRAKIGDKTIVKILCGDPQKELSGTYFKKNTAASALVLHTERWLVCRILHRWNLTEAFPLPHLPSVTKASPEQSC